VCSSVSVLLNGVLKIAIRKFTYFSEYRKICDITSLIAE
jgi:hypothetical protein